MKDSILIPTDFSVSSLNLVKQVLLEHPEDELNILLTFECQLTDSITDLLFLSKQSIIDSHSNEDFQDGLHILKNRFGSKIRTFRIEPFFGFNSRAFRAFVQANNVVHAYLPSDEVLEAHPDMHSLCTYAAKTNIPLTVYSWEDRVNSGQTQNSIFQLFNA